MRTILIAEADDRSLRAHGDELLLDGLDVHAAQTARHIQLRMAAVHPDALLLGPLESPVSSLTLLRMLRAGEIPDAERWLLVVALGGDSDHAATRLYQAGADLVLPSTASPLLIKGALDSLAARAEGDSGQRILRAGSLKIDSDARVASVKGAPVPLTRLEFDLLQTLARDPHRAFSKPELIAEVWGYDPDASVIGRTVDSHAYRLRRKLRAAGTGELVQSVRGVGYRLTR
jgi:DNA-binding response OmpR family regulator